nr:CHAD domain-containing protein [uncultured Cohaesibacter sp.]
MHFFAVLRLLLFRETIRVMAQIDDLLLLIPNRSLDCLIDEDFGKLRPIFSDQTEPEDAILLDMFPLPLTRSGRLLFASEGRLRLLDRDGALITQKGSPEGGFVRDLHKGPVRKALKGLPRLRALMPICRLQCSFSQMALVDEEGKIHIRVQLIETRMVGGADGLIAFLRPVRGYEKAQARGREKFLELGGGETGLEAFLSGLCMGFPAGVLKPEIAIGQNEPAFDVATDIMAAYLPAARVNEKGIVNDIDTEFLHDYRIALRKIRSVLSLFKGVYSEAQTRDLKQRFSALMAKTGQLRDLDVYLLNKKDFFALIPQELHGGVKEMFALFLRDRNEAAVELADHLISEAYQAEMQVLSDLLAAPERLEKGPNSDLGAHDYACRLIWKRYRKICKIAKSIDAESDDEDVHALRIHCKKLRYLMEFFAPLFPRKDVKRLIKSMKRLQDNLGTFNDCSVQIETLSGFMESHKFRSKATQMKVAKSVGALIAILHQRQAEERARVVENFSRFDSEATRQTFRTLFKMREGEE